MRVKFHWAKPVRCKVYDFKQGNFALPSSLQHFPFDIAFPENIDEYWLTWKDLFLTVVSECIPVKTVKDTNSPPWIDAEARHCLRKKYTALRKYRRRKTATNKLKLRTLSQKVKYVIRAKHRDYLKKIESWQKYTALRKYPRWKTATNKLKLGTLSQKVKYVVRAKHRDYLKKSESSFKSNPKLFWSYHKVILHSRGKPSVISYNGTSRCYRNLLSWQGRIIANEATELRSEVDSAEELTLKFCVTL